MVYWIAFEVVHALHVLVEVIFIVTQTENITLFSEPKFKKLLCSQISDP